MPQPQATHIAPSDNLSIRYLTELITSGESTRLEFKQTTGQLSRGMETLCAFLNADGGLLLFGVTDEGKITGQLLSDKTRRDIAGALLQLDPPVPVTVSYIALPDTDKCVIAMEAEAHHRLRPFTYSGKAWQRTESVTSLMSRTRYEELLLERGGVYRWELLPNPDLRIEDLDENALFKAVRGGINAGRLPETTLREEVPVILEKLNLMRNGVLNNAAMVLFGRDFYYYPQCLLRMARFKGTSREEFLDNQRLVGNVFELLDAAMAFCFKHLSLSGKIRALYREEELSVPVKALRECCINALCHRDYHRPGGSVGIAIYDDRLEIENSGAFPSDMTPARLLTEHCSEPPNITIASVMYKADLLESWGRGIHLMVSECRRVGLKDPEFHSDGSRVWVVFYPGSYLSHHKTATEGENTESKNKKTNLQTTDEILRQAPAAQKLSANRNQRVNRLLSILESQPLSLKEIMKELELSDRKSFLQNYLNPALEEHLIETLYPKGQHPRQKYQLSLAGKSRLQHDA